jgi:hypothetical protein
MILPLYHDFKADAAITAWIKESLRGNHNQSEGGTIMPKDSQIDNKKVRKQKSNGQTTLAEENQNQNRTTKKQSAKRGNV